MPGCSTLAKPTGLGQACLWASPTSWLQGLRTPRRLWFLVCWLLLLQRNQESDHWTSYSWANSVPIELYRCHGIPPGDDRFGGSQQLRLHALGPCWRACRQGYRPDYQDWSHSILSRSAPLPFNFHLHQFLLKHLVISRSWTSQVQLLCDVIDVFVIKL